MSSKGRQRDSHGFTAMVLCGGAGTRLRSVVADRPKPLAPIGCEPFLFRVLDQLAAAGCRQAILCSGHLGEQIERECGGEHAGVELLYSRETEPLGTGGAMVAALPLVESEDVVVVNGDSFTDLYLGAFVARARAEQVDVAMVAVQVADRSAFGAVELDDSDRVTRFCEKGVRGPGLVNAGIYWLPRQTIAAFPDGACSFEHDILPGLVERGVFADKTSGGFVDIGTPASYAAAEKFFARLDGRRSADRRGLLVIDRDGTLIEERHYLDDPGGVELLPGVVEGLRSFREHGYDVAIVTNQSGIGRGYFDVETVARVNEEVVRQLQGEGIPVEGVYVCPHHPDDGCSCRKPAPGLMARAMQELGYSASQCVVVGDKKCDVDLGQMLGARTALVRTGYGEATERDGLCAPDLIVDRLTELVPEVIS